jgi:hypothetical protein
MQIFVGIYLNLGGEEEMANNFLILGTLAAFGSIFIAGPPPTREPTVRPLVSPVEAINSSMPPSVRAGSNPALELRRDPVPLVRNVQASPASTASAKAPAAAVEEQPQDDLERRAAKAAVELDGYKRVTILGKASNGVWRFKGYRGTTEVVLTVDGTGRVSMD